jgi:spore coat polysaccharide biosynthesis protein SpsF
MSAAATTGVIVQMRIDSSRLPGKALLPLAGTTLAGAVMRRLRGITADAYILATDAAGAQALGPVAAALGFSVFAGPKYDVLARFVMAAGAFDLHRVVRATGDNPFVSVPLAELALDESDASGADYVGLVGMPVGMGVEVVRAEALVIAGLSTTSAFDREHVCPYLYGHPDEFLVRQPNCPDTYHNPQARVTVDTDDDYKRAMAIFAALGDEPSDDAILSWLRDERKDG